MYANHVPIINGAMRADLECFKRGVMFAILSARVRFPYVPEQCKELGRRGQEAGCLWGWKFDAYVYLQECGEASWHCARDNQDDPELAIRDLCLIPGLGIVKAAFVAQMLGHDVACVDSRNVKRLGMTDWPGMRNHKTRKSFAAKIARYVQETQGLAEKLWNEWCEDVAKFYLLGSANDVSAMHVKAIIPAGMKVKPIQPRRYENVPF